MKAILLVVVFVAVASAKPQFGLSNLVPLPSVIPSGPSYLTIFRTVSTVHSALSNSPLKPFLPSVTEMAMGAYRAYQTANDIQEGFKKANDYVNSMVKKAIASANIPIDQIMSSLPASVSEFLPQAPAVTNPITSALPTVPSISSMVG
ncbi:unnamed protein product [Orchesella dallaii]|uniref:Uncharacterized protein n=1 Tax=Orchesella dallaii TaxID=48710 RepID=A0ABP1QDR9_9HEXA